MPSSAPLALTLGDPAGIGPELALSAWLRRKSERISPFVVCGGRRVLGEAAAHLGLDIETASVTDLADVPARFENALPVLDGADARYSPGDPDDEGAKAARASLEQGTVLARDGRAAAVVTGPVSKARLASTGFAFPGQTEFLADAAGLAPDAVAMMIAGPSLRTVPLTIHVALADVPETLSTELIVSRARIVAAALQRDFGLSEPRLAIAALNPHAGENGAFGDEEARIIAPAIAQLEAEGLLVSGPHPADALFAPRARATYDAALCMYHDQALVPVKALDFDQGVNVTLGLPFIRTAPDHGTAFAIAGKGLADPGATIAALKLAGEMAARRR
ncbi:4-hydroxythreonine-4-phosphate dehydrogenase PdxA [Pseudoblastomonas halimionae]|uniref:4-hydroxythreonine-4-phosphate dehydrogenase n=1 Tax=Alteriqipengyuania halimionae TaxID=1926630 RepID=A0A6I4U3J9_9SPHN|nr:4-hydroxythreonine-4-phosphate dehydrogenase PdxA [Alteriqipengyuania halimionae]MXP09924.1 4-hydroxythreonine-4-phosphate dehydrogenase PdxA [Alteriqipengyuania halimionae]